MKNGFGARTTAEEVVAGLDLTGKTYLVTGCNAGLGHETMRVLAARGARVLGCARSQEKAEAACDRIDGETVPFVCELSEPASARACAEAVRAAGIEIDGLICNAGIMALPKLELFHGYEAQFLVNHVGHFILATGLLDQLTSDGRVVMVSSYGHRLAGRPGVDFQNLDGSRGYNAWRFYGQSKLANLLFARALARRFEEAGTEQLALALHPGVIDTELGRYMNGVMRWGMSLGGKLFFKTTEQGAATQVFAAAHPLARELNGGYLKNCRWKTPSKRGRDDALAEELWERTETIVDALLSA
jgi:NAD(P)-dependent dehydrogenase (short-subunit alcohol dehydrogenase family)